MTILRPCFVTSVIVMLGCAVKGVAVTLAHPFLVADVTCTSSGSQMLSTGHPFPTVHDPVRLRSTCGCDASRLIPGWPVHSARECSGHTCPASLGPGTSSSSMCRPLRLKSMMPCSTAGSLARRLFPCRPSGYFRCTSDSSRCAAATRTCSTTGANRSSHSGVSSRSAVRWQQAPACMLP